MNSRLVLGQSLEDLSYFIGSSKDSLRIEIDMHGKKRFISEGLQLCYDEEGFSRALPLRMDGYKVVEYDPVRIKGSDGGLYSYKEFKAHLAENDKGLAKLLRIGGNN